MTKAGATRPSSFPRHNGALVFVVRSGAAMSIPPPTPVSHTAEMVIATVVGVGIGLFRDNFLLGAGIGIALGILLSIAKTLYVDRKRRQQR
jgi:F0F1-type ATP synthase assembly protein I